MAASVTIKGHQPTLFWSLTRKLSVLLLQFQVALLLPPMMTMMMTTNTKTRIARATTTTSFTPKKTEEGAHCWLAW
uniref:Uncharacterized protein n=1 Tax=Anopheles darlingi TaxID=43151 RepID=A0A2M4DLW8_ANODA